MREQGIGCGLICSLLQAEAAGPDGIRQERPHLGHVLEAQDCVQVCVPAVRPVSPSHLNQPKQPTSSSTLQSAHAAMQVCCSHDALRTEFRERGSPRRFSPFCSPWPLLLHLLDVAPVLPFAIRLVLWRDTEQSAPHVSATYASMGRHVWKSSPAVSFRRYPSDEEQVPETRRTRAPT